ncbi:MAG: Fe-S cluster protein [Armatimonadota bacterium]|nr:MAG: Fe-S cluster protein [Armatimonadota bacterium]
MPNTLITSIEITHILPCLADPAKIRFHAETSADLAGVLPYLNTIIHGAIYNHAVPALTFNREHRIICLHPHRIAGAKVDDLDDARAILDDLSALINDTWARRDEITPCYERRERLTPVDIFKLLPRTNCRQCGLPTCLAFAVDIASEKRSIIQCAPLFDAPLKDKRDLLLTLLTDAGYQVPSPFRPTDDAR